MHSRRRQHAGLGPLLALVLIATVPGGRAAAQDGSITIAVATQGRAVEVDLDCALTQGGIERREHRQGVAPLSVTFTASAATCVVNAAGAVTIDASSADGSNISRVQTSGGRVQFSLSSG